MSGGGACTWKCVWRNKLSSSPGGAFVPAEGGPWEFDKETFRMAARVNQRARDPRRVEEPMPQNRRATHGRCRRTRVEARPAQHVLARPHAAAARRLHRLAGRVQTAAHGLLRQP